MRFHVILLRDGSGHVSVSVPAMPGCFSSGQSREDALANAREAMELWLDAESNEGRAPLEDSPAVIAAAVQNTLEIVHELRQDGSYGPNAPILIELVEVELPVPARAERVPRLPRDLRGADVRRAFERDGWVHVRPQRPASPSAHRQPPCPLHPPTAAPLLHQPLARAP